MEPLHPILAARRLLPWWGALTMSTGASRGRTSSSPAVSRSPAKSAVAPLTRSSPASEASFSCGPSAIPRRIGQRRRFLRLSASVVSRATPTARPPWRRSAVASPRLHAPRRSRPFSTRSRSIPSGRATRIRRSDRGARGRGARSRCAPLPRREAPARSTDSPESRRSSAAPRPRGATRPPGATTHARPPAPRRASRWRARRAACGHAGRNGTTAPTRSATAERRAADERERRPPRARFRSGPREREKETLQPRAAPIGATPCTSAGSSARDPCAFSSSMRSPDASSAPAAASRTRGMPVATAPRKRTHSAMKSVQSGITRRLRPSPTTGIAPNIRDWTPAVPIVAPPLCAKRDHPPAAARRARARTPPAEVPAFTRPPSGPAAPSPSTARNESWNPGSSTERGSARWSASPAMPHAVNGRHHDAEESAATRRRPEQCGPERRRGRAHEERRSPRARPARWPPSAPAGSRSMPREERDEAREDADVESRDREDVDRAPVPERVLDRRARFPSGRPRSIPRASAATGRAQGRGEGTRQPIRGGSHPGRRRARADPPAHRSRAGRS